MHGWSKGNSMTSLMELDLAELIGCSLLPKNHVVQQYLELGNQVSPENVA